MKGADNNLSPLFLMQLKKFVGVLNYSTALSVVTQENEEVFNGTLGELRVDDYASLGDCHVKDVKLVDPLGDLDTDVFSTDKSKGAYLRVRIKLV